MFAIRKRINSVNVHIRIQADKRETVVSGHAFPFGRQFHAVSFSAKRGVDLFSAPGIQIAPAEAEIGFGGNQFSGTQAARIMAAATVAFDQGNYFADLMNEMGDRGYGDVLLDAVDQGDPDHLLSCLLLIGGKNPNENQKAISSALRSIVEDARPLGVDGILTLDKFETLETNQKYGLMKLCTLSDLYEREDDSRTAHEEASRKVLRLTHESAMKEGMRK